MKRTAWLYYNGEPIQSVQVTHEDMTDDEVRRKMYDQLDSCPGVVCNYPYEAPFERRLKIAHGEIRYFGTELWSKAEYSERSNG